MNHPPRPLRLLLRPVRALSQQRRKVGAVPTARSCGHRPCALAEHLDGPAIAGSFAPFPVEP